MAIPSALMVLEEVAMGFPEATNTPFGNNSAPSYRVRNKIFVMVEEDLSAYWCKAPTGVQEMLVTAEPARFFAPPYLGKSGWIGVRLIDVDRDELAAILEDSYRLVAPKKLVTLLDSQAQN